MDHAIHRRQFLITSGYLSIGFTLFGCRPESNQTTIKPKVIPANFAMATSTAPLSDDDQIDAWLHILEDGTVRILTGRMELGQGVTIVMQQVAGEELNIPPQKIEVVLADTGRTPNEGYTSGSRSVESGAMSVRQAAAAARQLLLQLAAEQWEIPEDNLSLQDGYIQRKGGGQEKISFADLLQGKQLSETIPQNVDLKPKSDYQWVGRPLPHPDLEKIVRGQAVYVQDLRLPEMVHARVIRPPAYAAKLQSWDQSIKELPGVLTIIQNGSFLGVIADEEYTAVKAAEQLSASAKWDMGPDLPEVSSWAEYMIEQEKGKATTVGANSHYAVYTKPYIMHGSIGPSCAVAAFSDGRLHIWSHTQGVYPLRSTISKMTGLTEENIRITGMRGSGCYGHNGADDVAADAALLAMAYPERPVRVQWQRTDEHQWEPYGSAMRMELSASLNSNGRIQKWDYQLWSDGHSTRPRGDASYLAPARYLENAHSFNNPTRVGGGTRNAEAYYDIPSASVQDYHVNGPLRVSALRSLGAYANIFAIECFMEELAEKAGIPPLDFRLQHSSDERSVAVIQKLKEMIAKETLAEGEGMGYGFSRYKNSASYCAVAAKVQVDLAKKIIRPVKMWSVIDAGEVINPDGLKNQTEGGMIQAASWTLLEAVGFDANGITTKDWTSYPILRYNAVPATEVVVIDRPDQPPLGGGEAAQGPAGAAIANAVYAASGKRVRELPIERALFG